MEILVAGMALLLVLAIIGLVVRPCWRRRSTTSSLMMGRWSDFARGSEYTEPRSLELQPRTAPPRDSPGQSTPHEEPAFPTESVTSPSLGRDVVNFGKSVVIKG